jgi:hypothetical protein
MTRWNDTNAREPLTKCIEDAFAQPAMQQPFPSSVCAEKKVRCEDTQQKCLGPERDAHECDKTAEAKCKPADHEKLASCLGACPSASGCATPAACQKAAATFEACSKKCAAAAGGEDCKALSEKQCGDRHALLASCQHDASQACNLPDCAREEREHCKKEYDVAWRCTTR